MAEGPTPRVSPRLYAPLVPLASATYYRDLLTIPFYFETPRGVHGTTNLLQGTTISIKYFQLSGEATDKLVLDG